MAKIKPKKCGYSKCGKMFVPQYSTLQPVCSPKCAHLYNSEKEINKRFEEAQTESVTNKELEKAARLIFQKWIRERDKNEKCISCFRTINDIAPTMWDAGHYFSAERFSGLIFEETNVHKQCKFCNGTKMHGNLIEYRKGLIARFGEDYVFELESISDANRVYKYSRSELIDIANKYKVKLKKLIQANSEPSI